MIRRPRNFKLGDMEKHELECGSGDADLIYLKPSEATYLWVGGLGRLRRLRTWLDKSIAYLEAKQKGGIK